MDGITAYCKDNKVMKVFLGKEDIFLEKKEKLKKEGLIRCENIGMLLKDSFRGKNIDFSKYIDLNMLNITDFEKKVYIETMKISKGEVKSYKEIGEAIGTKGYRAVGNALNKNPIAIIVPCHRVIGSNMKLTGFRGGLDMKKEMLKNEGIKIEKEKVIR
jgi:methylated-DNA-[protein]-cysteine S-methyltransferase